MTIPADSQRIVEHLAATFDETPRDHIVDVVESYTATVGRGGSDQERRLLVEFLSRDRLWDERGTRRPAC